MDAHQPEHFFTRVPPPVFFMAFPMAQNFLNGIDARGGGQSIMDPAAVVNESTQIVNITFWRYSDE
jgi:hypothetical protein